MSNADPVAVAEEFIQYIRMNPVRQAVLPPAWLPEHIEVLLSFASLSR